MPTFSSASPRSVVETWPHALPYRVLFEEQRARRGPEFSALLLKWATPPTGVEPIAPVDAEQLLESALQRVAEAYAGLEEARAYLRKACRRRCDSPKQRKQVIDDAHKAVDDAAIECRTADIPLEASAASLPQFCRVLLRRRHAQCEFFVRDTPGTGAFQPRGSSREWFSAPASLSLHCIRRRIHRLMADGMGPTQQLQSSG